MIDKTSQLSAIQEKDQQKKLLESKLAQLFYVTCEQELNDESSLVIVSSFLSKLLENIRCITLFVLILIWQDNPLFQTKVVAGCLMLSPSP